MFIYIYVVVVLVCGNVNVYYSFFFPSSLLSSLSLLILLYFQGRGGGIFLSPYTYTTSRVEWLNKLKKYILRERHLAAALILILYCTSS